MSRFSGLVIWLIGLMGCAIPIVIIFASYLFPDTGPVSGLTLMDIARQTYPNILFLVIAVSGIAIAEALMLFFRMVEVGEARATPALWLLTMVLLIVFSSISYAKVAGGNFDPERVSDQQLFLAIAGGVMAVIAALALRMSVIKLEQVARQHVHDNAVVSTLEEVRENQADQLDLYDFSQYATNLPRQVGEKPKGDGETGAEEKPASAPPASAIKRPEPRSSTEGGFLTPKAGVSTAEEQKDTKDEADTEEAQEAEEVNAPKMPAFDASAEEEAEPEVEDSPKEEATAKEPEPEPEKKPEVVRPAKRAAKQETETVPASKSIAKNRRFTRRSAGTRIKKPRSKDAKV